MHAVWRNGATYVQIQFTIQDDDHPNAKATKYVAMSTSEDHELTLSLLLTGVDMQLCILHHRVQAQTMSNEVQTLYEFLGSDNPAPSKTAEAVELDLWRAWDRHVAGAQREEKKGGRKIHELDEERSLYLAVMDVLMTRKEMRKYYDKVILLPLTIAVDREPVLRSLCGKHWLAMQ